MNTGTKEALEEILQSEKDDGFQQGINAGYIIAKRIAGWWQENHKLKEPRSIQLLNEWTNDALEELKRASL